MKPTLSITKEDEKIRIYCHPAIAATLHYSLDKLTHTYGGTPSKSKISTKKYKGITEDQALLDEYKIELYNERQKLANELLAKIVIGAQLNILLTFEEADSLLAMLNDRRMELGNKFNITEEDMVGRVPLDKPIGQALAEISMLSIFQELIINAL